MVTCDFRSAISLIGDGDLIALRSTDTLLAKSTVRLLDTPYTHTAVAVWLEGGVWVTEMHASGNVLVPLSQYESEDWDVYACPVEDRMLVRREVFDHMRKPIKYDFLDLFLILMNRWFGMKLPRNEDDAFVCSAYSALLYIHAGWTPDGLPSIAAPSDVVAALKANPTILYRFY